jgi:hypothetical protein
MQCIVNVPSRHCFARLRKATKVSAITATAPGDISKEHTLNMWRMLPPCHPDRSMKLMCDVMKQPFPQTSWEWHRVDRFKRQNNNKPPELTLNGEHIDFHTRSFQKFQIISCTDRELWTKEQNDISDMIFTPKFKKTAWSLRSYKNGQRGYDRLEYNGRAS